jgi:murein DD-endopeptidase MepM/ murein hydrolase activator NlpD
MGKALPVTQGYLPNGQHAGIDFGSTGDGVTSVSAPINGTIAANTSACGKVAIFDGVNTLIFAHMTARTGLAVGSAITTGTYLGKASQVVGGGCSASGPHLHMEIRTGNNTNMALPSANNSATTLNPLTYQYGPFAAVSLVSPAANATLPGNPANVPFQWTAVQGAST